MRKPEDIKKLRKLGASLPNADTYHKGLFHLCKWVTFISLAISFLFWIALYVTGVREVSIYLFITLFIFVLFLYMAVGVWPYTIRSAIDVTRYLQKKGMTKDHLKKQYQQSMQDIFTRNPSKEE
ncbi:magnesium-transporting ATPase (P-type) [Gracilibacillus halotolerans]|uniref:Magnesium-transporting ATPase (P-type) n=1 Tax=Gracilibacillus halotolerans TaxID=74386 RepID=A0A841RFZ5_9BACI|nr:hypothetical protein [Gracilibacillus halotolerans]MBB6513030.1 magnesium-transporting ATPase (P-type) [Gracilibacillus halotolerans]